jgi:hypothetical protein
MSSRLPDPLPHTRWTRVRAVLNWVNLSTPLGLLVARLGGATITPAERGSVIVSKHDVEHVAARPALLRHEDRHCTQYAVVLGVAMLPLYAVSAGVSWVVAGDLSSYNPFERLADLAEGSYPPPTTRLAKRRG